MGHPVNNIFYTDDDIDDHLIFSIALSEVKPSVTMHSFFSCDQILAYLYGENNPSPDIIFLDQNMPGNGGNECLKEIKKITRMQNTPVIMYTTGGHPKLVGNALQLGAYKYVLKPTILPEIQENLSNLISECEQLPS